MFDFVKLPAKLKNNWLNMLWWNAWNFSKLLLVIIYILYGTFVMLISHVFFPFSICENDGIVEKCLLPLKYSLCTIFLSSRSQPFFFLRLVLDSRQLFRQSHFRVYLLLVPASTSNAVLLIFWENLKLSKNYTGHKTRVSLILIHVPCIFYYFVK